VAAVQVASWRAAYQGLLTDRYLADLSEEEAADRWARVIAGTADRVVVVEIGPTVLGYARVGPSRDDDARPGTGELYSLYLDPRRWGTGVGRALHDGALDVLATSGFTSATLWVLGTNARARAFYHRRGWVQVAGLRTQEFDGRVVTDFRYGRSLPAGSGAPG
jgi:ribosomal protein S18 acetylase RimI-like enzyme